MARISVCMVTDDANSNTDTGPASRHDQVAAVLDLMRPAVQADGGDVELIDVTDDGIVTVRMHGACVGCPSSAITLKAGIERLMQQRVEGIKEVRSVD